MAAHGRKHRLRGLRAAVRPRRIWAIHLVNGGIAADHCANQSVGERFARHMRGRTPCRAGRLDAELAEELRDQSEPEVVYRLRSAVIE